ncbi:unnamed protein product [Spirodela intermedia]|uniref:RRM domain-containing protein n=1 Tax=Spirodela intermedia TaxID=51605 RepID=A0A7I8L296_SPIIN|nr:unnamed protein product [Spirodela intermedia]
MGKRPPDVFESLFAPDNPFRRKPEPQAPPPKQEDQHQIRVASPSSKGADEGVDGAGAGGPVDGTGLSGEEGPGAVSSRKRKKAVVSVVSAEDDREDDKRQRKDGGRPAEKRKKRKRDELEAEYERRKLGYVVNGSKASKEGSEGEKDSVGVAVGRKRKGMDEGKDMKLEESFDDESKLLRTVFVGNLPLKTKRKALLKEFSGFGEVESIRLRSVPLLDTKTPRKGAIIKGQVNEAVDSVNAYIVFKDEQSARAALVRNMGKFDGNHIRVDMACPPRKKMKTETPLYNMKRSVFVGNLPFDVKDEEVYQLFCEDNQLGSNVEAIRVIRDPQTSLGKGIAYVLLKTREAANAVVRRKYWKLRDRSLRLSHAKSESAPTKATTPQKRSGPWDRRADFPSKRAETASEVTPSSKSSRPSKSGSLSYQGLRASKNGAEKKVGRSSASGRQNPFFQPRTPASAEQRDLKRKRPAVAARKAKTLRELGKKRKQEGATPENAHRSKKPRHLK